MIKKIKIFIAIIFIAALALLIYFFNALSSPASHQSRQVYFVVESGQGVNEISANLHQDGLISNKFIFETYVWLKGLEEKVIAGEYMLNSNMSMKEIIRLLTTGRVVKEEANITIIEGWRKTQIAQMLEDKGLIDKDEFILATAIDDWRFKYDFLSDLPVDDLEGFLFPDTYRIYVDAKPKDVIKKMLDNFDKKINKEMRADIKKSGRNLHQIIIMASIIESEASSLSEVEMAMVSDVFWKRYEAGMALQSDATVNYITGKYLLRPTYADLETDSPYNTYKYAGLPPTPIGNPGLDAIMAAIYPKENDYYYFLTDKDENIYFAVSYNQHLSNIKKYLN